MEHVLLDHGNEETIKITRDLGCWSGFSIYPNTKMSPQRMTAIVQEYGIERMIINSAADWGVSDPLMIPRTVLKMQQARIPDEHDRAARLAQPGRLLRAERPHGQGSPGVARAGEPPRDVGRELAAPRAGPGPDVAEGRRHARPPASPRLRPRRRREGLPRPSKGEAPGGRRERPPRPLGAARPPHRARAAERRVARTSRAESSPTSPRGAPATPRASYSSRPRKPTTTRWSTSTSTATWRRRRSSSAA